jgi:dephospho-CoA kinase
MKNPDTKYRCIGITGMPNAGKDACSRYLEKDFNYLTIRMSSVVVEEARKHLGREPTRADLQETGLKLREEYGFGVVARRVVDDWIPWMITNIERGLENEKRVFNPAKLRYVFNGIRSSEEVGVFKREYRGDFTLIAVCAGFKTRYERAKHRMRRGFDNFDIEQFEKLDSLELKLGLGNAIALADHFVVNEGTMDDLFIQLRKLVTIR